MCIGNIFKHYVQNVVTRFFYNPLFVLKNIYHGEDPTLIVSNPTYYNLNQIHTNNTCDNFPWIPILVQHKIKKSINKQSAYQMEIKKPTNIQSKNLSEVHINLKKPTSK